MRCSSNQNRNRGGAVGFQTARAPRSPTRTIQTNATTAAATRRIGNPIRKTADCLAAASTPSEVRLENEEHIEQADDSENDHDIEQLVGQQGMLQDQIAHGVSRLDAQRRLERQTALPGDKRYAGGADEGDGQRPARPFASWEMRRGEPAVQPMGR